MVLLPVLLTDAVHPVDGTAVFLRDLGGVHGLQVFDHGLGIDARAFDAKVCKLVAPPTNRSFGWTVGTEATRDFLERVAFLAKLDSAQERGFPIACA
jgi:hypothetical protein